jgi:tight adherence protein B
VTGALAFGLSIALAIIFVFVGIWRMAPRRDAMEERLQEYGYEDALPVEVGRATRGPRALAPLLRLAGRFSQGPRLAAALAQADIPLTAAEFSLIMIGLGGLGFFVGTLRINLLMGLLTGAICAYLPMIYLRRVQAKRKVALTNQLPDVLTLLIGSLRAGYGLNQALEVLVDQLPAPSSREFERVLRAVNLGMPVHQALSDMARRVQSDDFNLVVTAINVQSELGGNLAQVLGTISSTVTERIRILREVRTLTAQQRITGYILAGLPIVLAVGFSLVSPKHFDPFFEPGLLQLVPLAAFVLVVAGFLIIQRIVDIEV